MLGAVDEPSLTGEEHSAISVQTLGLMRGGDVITKTIRRFSTEIGGAIAARTRLALGKEPAPTFLKPALEAEFADPLRVETEQRQKLAALQRGPDAADSFARAPRADLLPLDTPGPLSVIDAVALSLVGYPAPPLPRPLSPGLLPAPAVRHRERRRHT